MKLRSESRTMAASATPIAFVLPATHAITMSNASSPLLSLPQELKDRIYHFVYGGFDIDVVFKLTYADTTMCLFARKSKEPPNSRIGSHRSEDRLRVASLGTCRQMYHAANNVFYSANNFRFREPKMIHRFLRRLGDVNHRNLAVRSVHLELTVFETKEEREWDNAFRALAENFKNLQQIHVKVHDWIWTSFYPSKGRYSPAYRKRPFLQGLLELKKLRLKTLELVMPEMTDNIPTREIRFRWTNAQRREWAQSMKSAILGSG